MPINESLLKEYKQECANTRKLLELVPFDNPDWKPHEKSMSLNNLSIHVADIPNWVTITLDRDQLDFAKGDYVPKTAVNSAELLKIHDDAVASAIQSLTAASDGKLSGELDHAQRGTDIFYFAKTNQPENLGFQSFVPS